MSEVFSGIRTMFKSPIQDLTKKYCVVGVPYDKTSTYRSGSRFGPSSIREASMMLCDGVDANTEIDVMNLVTDYGDVDFDPYMGLNEIKNDNIILLGGEHSISYMGIHEACKRNDFKPINVLHFDAHCDTWETKSIEHGSFMRHAINNGLVNSVYQYGVRSPLPLDVKEWNKQFVNSISDINCIEIKENSKWYITLDIDCIDPAFAPGTGTPESFGLYPVEVVNSLFNFIENVSNRKGNIVGFDVVEVNPSYDNSQITSVLASNLIWKYISAREFYKV